MSAEFTPQVRALLDRLEPPPLSADFADRVVAQAEAAAVLPPLPRLRKPGWRRGPRLVLAAGAAALLGVAAAAAVVPAEAWRKVPVIGEIVELIAPRETDRALPPPAGEPAAVEPAVAETTTPEAAPPVEPETRSVAQAPPQVTNAEIAAPPAAASDPSPVHAEPFERVREAAPEPVRVAPLAERPAPEPTRGEVTTVDTRTAPAPERIRPADTSDTRQQQRERTVTTREATRDRAARHLRPATRAH